MEAGYSGASIRMGALVSASENSAARQKTKVTYTLDPDFTHRRAVRAAAVRNSPPTWISALERNRDRLTAEDRRRLLTLVMSLGGVDTGGDAA